MIAVGLVIVAACRTVAEEVVLWPSDATVMCAQPDSSITPLADGALAVATGVKARWPGVRMDFVRGETDLSRFGRVMIALSNMTDRVRTINLSVKGVTRCGQSPVGALTLGPHATGVLTTDFTNMPPVLDVPAKFCGMRGSPDATGKFVFDLRRTKSFHVFLFQDGAASNFSVSRVTVSTDGVKQKRLAAATFFPFVDRFGQFSHDDWPGKVHDEAELQKTREDEDAWLAAHRDSPIPGCDRFGGWADGPQLKATGFFRTEKVNGKWWLVDPDGRLFLSHGVNCGWELASTGISGREGYFEKLPPREGATKPFWTYHKKPVFRNFYGDPKNAPFWSFSFSAYNCWLKFGDDWRRKNAENTARRMHAWGLNTTTGTGGDLMRCANRVPYVVSIGPSSRKIEGANGYWGKLLDPFAPEFAESCRRSAEARRAAGTNAWCVGWTSNNELSWGADGIALARGVLASPDDQPAKVALLKLLAERGVAPDKATDADLRRLGEAVAERYYSTVRAAIKAVAPNHLYLGDRNDKRNPEVFRVASRYLDVVTVNVYEHRPSVTLPPDAEDKPLMVTEFHFGCYDTGYFYASLIPVKDQKTRAACYRDYLRTVIDRPDYVGAHWFCWRDCPITGQLGEGANAQCGLVSTADVPYSELVGAIRDISAEMYERRFSR